MDLNRRLIRERVAAQVVSRFLLATVLLASPLASAQDEDNGWTYWQEAIEYLQPSNDANVPIISEDERAMLRAYLEGPMRTPTSAEQTVLARLGPTLALIQRAAACETYDAGIDFSAGFETLLPHLGPMRMGAQLLAVQARASAAAGDLTGAAAWLGVLGAISTQPSTDRIAISSLVSAAIYSYTDRQLEQFIGAGLIDRESAAAIVSQFHKLYDDDPFDFAGAVAREGETILQFLDAAAEGNGNAEQDFLESLGIDSSSLPEQDLAMQREIAEDLFSELTEAFHDPDRERGRASIEALSLEIQELPDAAALLRLVMPSLENLFDARENVERALANRLRQLESVASGRIKPEALLNAAIVWLDAGRRAASLDTLDQVAAMDLLLGVSEPGARAAAQGHWVETMNSTAQPLLIAGLDAASIPNASFHTIADERRPFVEAPYLGELRAIGRVLLAAAHARRVAWAEGEASDSLNVDALLGAEEISAVLQLVEHLASDPALAHTVLAAALFESAVAEIQAYVEVILAREAGAIAEPEFDRAILSRLRAAMEHLPRADPFGLRAAAASDRTEALDRFWPTAKSLRSSQRGNDLPEVLDDLPPDRLASLIAMGNGRQPLEGALPGHAAPILLANTTELFGLRPLDEAFGAQRDPKFRSIARAIAIRPANARSAIRRLSLDSIIDIEQRVREAYARVTDADRALRPGRE